MQQPGSQAVAIDESFEWSPVEHGRWTLFGAREGSRRSVLFLVVLATILTMLPVLAAQHLPLMDPPGHEARLSALRDLLITGKGSPFYDVASFYLPNVAFDVVGLAMAVLFDAETVGKLFFALTLVMTLGGTVVLNRVAIGRWSAAPCISALVLYNLISIMGFLSYAFGLALVPWFLAGLLALDRVTGVRYYAAAVATGLVLLFCHVSAYGIFAAMAGGFAIDGLIRRRMPFGRFVLRGAALSVPIAFYLSMPAGSEDHFKYGPNLVAVKLTGLITAITSASLVGDIACLVGGAAFLLLILAFARTRIASPFVPGLAILAVLYCVLPYMLGSGYYVDRRIPIAIALIGSAALDVRIRSSSIATFLVVLVGASLAVKQSALAALWRSFDPPINHLVGQLRSLPAGAVLMQAECAGGVDGPMHFYLEKQPPLTHVAALATLDGKRFSPTTWALRDQQPIRIKPAYKPYYDLYWRQWEMPYLCTARGLHSALGEIAQLGAAQAQSGQPVPPLYFFLIRPPSRNLLSDVARQVAAGPNYELYDISRLR